MKIGQTLHGFRCIHIEDVEEIKAKSLLFEHEKTKAPVMVLDCDDDNKVFCTYFRTPVSDDTGVPHILEHSVLNGSRKYPLKEPFLELIKASLYTFLNAMTYDDKTVYPVASRNAQDFHNLMDVYLDAVYHPNLTRETFMQEGWHYEVDDDRNIAFSGVVYNEMLGATSSPESLLYDKIQSLLLPTSSYHYNSGGDPEAIPELTYDQFIDFHKTFYHPSNSRTVLYGNLDLDERLAHLAEYFDAFDYQDIDSTITTQTPFTAPRQEKISYPTTPDSDLSGKSYVIRGWLLGEPESRETSLALEILSFVLTGTQASPLRRALIESQLGEQTIQWLSSHTIDNYFIFGLKGTDEEKASEIEDLIDTTLVNLVTNGIDAKTIDAAVNTIEFNLREANFGSQPKGLIYALASAETWLYDKDPLSPLRYENELKAIKEKIAAGGFLEGLIKTHFIDNTHRLTMTMVPDKTHESQRLERLKTRLSDTQNNLKDSDIDHLVENCKKLHEIQVTPDTPEALASIPKLPLDCIDRKAEELDFQMIDSSINLSFSQQQTNGIAYIKLHFNADMLDAEQLPYLPTFSQALMQTGTSTKSYIDLTQEIGIQTGGIRTYFDTTPLYGAPETIHKFLECTGKSLKDKLPEMLSLMTEALTDSNLGDVKRITEIIRMNRSEMEANIKGNGSSFAITRLEASHSVSGRYNEALGGIEQFRFLESLADQLDSAPKAICDKLLEIRDTLINRNALCIHLTGGTEELATLQNALPKALANLPAAPVIPHKLTLPAIPVGESFIVPSKVQYVCQGLNFADHGTPYSGEAKVLCKLLGSDYLWNKVRVQGNAYGCFCNFAMISGTFYVCSYRDPRLQETIDAYKEITDYLAAIDLPHDEFEKIIIGTMGKVDTPLSPSQKGSIAFNKHISGITQAVIQKQREEILDCSQETIRGYAAIFQTLNEKGSLCVFGGREKLTESSSLFDSLIDLFADDAPDAS